jgi:hypothetical protein
MYISTFLEGNSKLGRTPQSDFLRNYLTELNAESIVVEDQYIDKDYLIDYCNFHARSFNDYGKYTTRLHFFSKKFTQEEFETKFLTTDFQIELQDSYLGFVVVKPIDYKCEHNFIGRTILKTYDPKTYNKETKRKEMRHYTTFEYPVSLYGIPLKIYSLPFQAQDSIVAACATTSIWTSLHALNKLFGIQNQSPSEITKIATSTIGYDRNFPSVSLDILQMKKYFDLIGLETESIYVASYEGAKLIPDIIKAFLSFKLPIIACMCLEKKDKNGRSIKEGHAVVVSGYRSDDDGNISRIYVHDDGICPYSSVKRVDGDKSFLCWDNEWKAKGYERMQLVRFLIPLYPKIRLSFNRIYGKYSQIREKNNKKNYLTTLSLVEINKYKEELLDINRKFEDKVTILLKPMPKYNWLIRVETKDKLIADYIVDATSMFPSVTKIKYVQ